jgi:NMD protein affecting ribosome stability and mRNA decay
MKNLECSVCGEPIHSLDGENGTCGNCLRKQEDSIDK